MRPAVFAVGDGKKKNEREGKAQKVTGRYTLSICGAGTPGPIPKKFGMHFAPSNVINNYGFCYKIF